MGEGESADEEAHRKTDAAKKRHAIDLRPACAAGPFRDPPTVRQPDSAEDADLLAEEQAKRHAQRSEEHTSELQSLMRISYAVFCLKKKNTTQQTTKRTANKRT